VASDPADPRFITADLNGDGAQDLVAVVSPSRERLSDVNSRLANWIVQNLGPEPPGRRPAGYASARVEEGDSLLAVIHGQGPDGWRSPEARQAYLLRNAVGREMQAVHAEDVAAGSRTPSRLRGDVLTCKSSEALGFLYWNGARYAFWNWANLLQAPTHHSQ
jgi:hypothetical protein